jgi:hypothetical protein
VSTKWHEGQKVRGKNQYAGKTGSVTKHNGIVSRSSASKQNKDGEVVYVKWDRERRDFDVVEDCNLEKI